MIRQYLLCEIFGFALDVRLLFRLPVGRIRSIGIESKKKFVHFLHVLSRDKHNVSSKISSFQ